MSRLMAPSLPSAAVASATHKAPDAEVCILPRQAGL